MAAAKSLANGFSFHISALMVNNRQLPDSAQVYQRLAERPPGGLMGVPSRDDLRNWRKVCNLKTHTVTR